MSLRTENKREYDTWLNMKSRCNSDKPILAKSYKNKGITVCKRWSNSFSNFLSDMGKRPDGMSIDRIDNSKGYSPKNCRWTDISTQEQNRDYTHKIIFNNKEYTLTELSKVYKIPYNYLYNRIYIYKWDIDRAVNKKLIIRKLKHRKRTNEHWNLLSINLLK